MQHKETSCSLALLIPTKDRFDELLLLLKRLEKEDPEVVCVYISDNASQDPRYRQELNLIAKKHPLKINITHHHELINVFENWKSLLVIPSTKYLAFCGDDDFWEAGGLSQTIKWMENCNVDFTYPEKWHLHSRKLPNQETMSMHELPPLPKAPLERVLAFYKYDNDPMVYGIFEADLMKKMFDNLHSGWKLLPKAHITDTAYLGIISVLLHARNPGWSNVCYHSQGIDARTVSNLTPRLRHYIAAKTNIYYIVRKTQLLFGTIYMSSKLSKSRLEALVFSLRLFAVVFSRVPIVIAIKNDVKALARAITLQ